MNAVANRVDARRRAAAISCCGTVDLSNELNLNRKDAFKCLSWWEEKDTRTVHAFLSLGIASMPLMKVEGITPVLQFADWVPWLDLKAVANGYIQSMDIFADNAIDWGCADYAGIYLGCEVVSGRVSQEDTAREILGHCDPAVAADAECMLWGLWEKAPYAYLPGTPYEKRCIKSGHRLISSAGKMTLEAKSEILAGF